MARAIMEVFVPPGMCWGSGKYRFSSISKANPSANPPAAGKKASRPSAAAASMAGSSSDQTDAAVITPAAQPSSTFSTV